ncbi:TIM barrel protein [Paenibacillus sp. FSL W8-1187]|uniref:sugar phosphate isomerase/epimerase family protein n=1 Tax=Paenibacillus sp. FSL W8-1187 TaxID=2975339 RepID=UPI0030D9CE61
MKLLFFKALWGMEGTLEDKLSRAAAHGYAGVEMPLPPVGEEARLEALLERHGLQLILQLFTDGDHVASFRQQMERAAAFRPAAIVSHSARDAMPEEEQDRFFDAALEIERRHGAAVCHETHRGRAMFTPWTTSRLLRKFPELKLAADFSHWMAVCESHLENQQDHLEQAIARSFHIHGRIGHPQGPQVPHPAAPEYARELELFTGWWRDIAAVRRAADSPQLTFTAEFGPPGYLPTLPFTRQPVADLWELNEWMREHARERLQG